MDPWWGRFELETGAAGRWLVGPLELWASCRPREWRIAHLHLPDPLVERREITVPLPAFEPPDAATVLRFTTDVEDRALQLAPRLADRPVVVRPDPPLHLLPGDEVELYVSTPLWAALSTSRGKLMTEVPTARPTDTWFGPNTREGELCYAVLTRARLTLDQVPRVPARAITVLAMRNEGADALVLERVKVPAPHLTLFRDRDGTLWTNRVKVVRGADDDDATVQVGAGPPRPGAEVLAPPRLTGTPSMLVRAVGALLG